MNLNVVAAEVDRDNGEAREYRVDAIKQLASEVAENNRKPEVITTPLRAEFWRQEAAHASERADEMKANCSGRAKVQANFAHLLGSQICGSDSPAAIVSLGKAKAGLRPY
jgi:hypothetical protein